MTLSGPKQGEQAGEWPFNEVLPLQIAAAKSLLGKLVWFDILATVSTRKGPFLGIQHKQLLESGTADMAGASGCHNLIAIALLEMSDLESWKEEAESERTLSMIELVNRGGTIIKSLNAFIARAEDGMTTDDTSASASYMHEMGRSMVKWRDELGQDITSAFARAALVYVHTIISGTNSNAMEIQRAIESLSKSLEKVLEKGMTEYALWPLCVAVCSAADEEEERRMFRFLEFGKHHDDTAHLHTYKVIREIGRECRKLRLIDGGRSWVRAMDRLQSHVLLA